MIVRAWHARAARSDPLAYVEHFRRVVLPHLCRIDGFLGASLLKAEAADSIDFLVLTRWASMAAVRAFAGEHPTRAVVEPAAVAGLVDFDRTVQHYEVVDDILLSEGSAGGEVPPGPVTL